VSRYRTATLDEITSEKWPYWIPVRHHFGIETFGINLWRDREDGTVIPEHDEVESGAPELYYVVDGHATFAIAGEALDAPAGTLVWVADPSAARAARAAAAGTLVLSVSGAAPGEAYRPEGWDSQYLEGE
jgi:hypothetical protein